MIGMGLLLSGLAALVACAVTWWVLRAARRLKLLQVPNERSSHQVPTPGGGGVGIVAGSVVAALPSMFGLPYVAVPVVLAGLLLALVGYWDDRRPLPARFRLGAQLLLMAAALAVVPLDPLVAQLPIPAADLVLWLGLSVLGALFINLFNFMDGIDGLAASGAIFVVLGSGGLAVLASPGLLLYPPFWWMLGLAAAIAGFLVFNFPPARIFMGDVGSTFIGLMLAFFAVVGVVAEWFTLWQWLVLAGLLLADSLTTLLRRLLRGERVWLAHRRHAYQALQRRFGSHRKVTLLYLAVDLLLLLPLAWLAGLWPDHGWAIALGTYALLVPAMIAAGAGASPATDAGARTTG